jgi:hypothetical protein
MVYFTLTSRISEIKFGTPPRISGIEIGTPPGFLEFLNWGVRILHAMAQCKRIIFPLARIFMTPKI